MCFLVSIPVVTPDAEIWFLDRALYWHFLTDTFTAYYRLLITHLGLPQWQYAFTSYGISPQAKVGEQELHLDSAVSLNMSQSFHLSQDLAQSWV